MFDYDHDSITHISVQRAHDKEYNIRSKVSGKHIRDIPSVRFSEVSDTNLSLQDAPQMINDIEIWRLRWPLTLFIPIINQISGTHRSITILKDAVSTRE